MSLFFCNPPFSYVFPKMSKQYVPFICTNNSFGNIDYGRPIIAAKSTDYRTSTGLYHRFIPNRPQEFDCRIKARIKPELKETKVEIRDATVESLYENNFDWKFKNQDVNVHYPQCKRAKDILYLRDVQEKIFRNPPTVKPLKISEMKESYIRKYVKFPEREVFPPEPFAKCEIRALGRDEQPAIRPEEKGHWKLNDPYLTTNRLTYVPFTANQRDAVADVRLNKAINEPLVPSKAVPMLDKMPFKKHPINRRVRPILKSVPNFGKTSEMKANYVHQCFSGMLPYLFENGVDFPESLSKSCAWQDLAPPGMYCTDYCHIGSNWPINSIIDYGLPLEYVKHDPCYDAKFCDWSQ